MAGPQRTEFAGQLPDPRCTSDLRHRSRLEGSEISIERCFNLLHISRRTSDVIDKLGSGGFKSRNGLLDRSLELVPAHEGPRELLDHSAFKVVRFIYVPKDGVVGDNQLRLPWEGGEDLTEQRVHLERLGLELLETLGYDPSLEGLRETPARWARWWQEFHGFDAGNSDTTFQSVSSDELVVVSGIQVWSICEHHLLPFSALVSIGYVPQDKLLGLSKFARIAHRAAHRLQLQERLAEEIADAVEVRVASPDIGVLVRGRHLCMEARGIRSPSVASALVTRGALRNNEQRRREFLQLAGAIPRAEQGAHSVLAADAAALFPEG